MIRTQYPPQHLHSQHHNGNNDNPGTIEATRLLQQPPAARRGSFDEYPSRPDHGERLGEHQTTIALSISQPEETERNPTPTKMQQAARSGKGTSKRLSRRIAHRRALCLLEAKTTPTFESTLVMPTTDITICQRKYGFTCDPDLSTHTNLMQTLQACLHDHISVDSAPRNRKVHNLCQDPASVPPNVLYALGFGLGFCLSLKHKDQNPITLSWDGDAYLVCL
jgi:hypothetical protein